MEALLRSKSIRSGGVVASAAAFYTGITGITAIIPTDDTIPQSSEGIEVMSVSITPASANNKLRIRSCGVFTNDSSGVGNAFALFKDSDVNALRAAFLVITTGNRDQVFALEAEISPATTSAVTIKLRAGVSSSTMRPNANANPARIGGGSQAWSLIVEEIKA